MAKSTIGRHANTGHAQEGYKDTCGKCGAKRIDQQIGLEETPEQYVAKLVEVFREVRRVLHPSGVLFLNIGDSYASRLRQAGDEHAGPLSKSARGVITDVSRPLAPGYKEKDLYGIPWMLAFALRADGWWLRSAITWCKGNPMPESVTDRPTSATEMVFMLAKSQTYFYDAEAIAEPASQPLGVPKRTGQHKATVLGEYRGMYADTPSSGLGTNQGAATRNRRNWWVVNSEPYSGAHYATMPTKLVEPCVLAGTSIKCCAKCLAPYERVVEREQPERQPLSDVRHTPAGTHKKIGGQYQKWLDANPPQTIGWEPTCTCNAEVQPCVVLDPFCGSGTTLAVALKFGRRAIGIDLDSRNMALCHDRIARMQPMLLDVTP